MKNITDTDKLPVDDEKRLRVHLVPMPSGDNPWRTRADYKNEQKRDTVRFYIIIVSFVVSVIAATLSWVQTTEAKKERIQAENALEQANAAKENVTETANALLKISYIIADGSSRLGGMPKEHMNKIKEYQNSISSYLDKNLDNDIETEIEDLNLLIDK